MGVSDAWRFVNILFILRSTVKMGYMEHGFVHPKWTIQSLPVNVAPLGLGDWQKCHINRLSN